MIPDSEARSQALDIRQSFAVAAPAGSGKTGLLTQRILCLLAECERPEAILCMTFTRKAAAEMQRRVIEALHSGENPEAPTDTYEHHTWQLARRVLERDRAMNWQLLDSPQRLQITTIDGFCRLLAQQLTVESGLGAMPENTENPEPLYRQATRELLAELESLGQTGDALEVLLTHFDNNHEQFETMLIELLAKREQWLSHVVNSRDARVHLETALATLIADTLHKAKKSLESFTGELTILLDYINLHLDHDDLNLPILDTKSPDLNVDTSAHLQAWHALSRIFITNEGKWRKQANKNIGLPTKKDSQQPDLAEQSKTQWKTLIEAFRETPGLLDLFNDVSSLPGANYDHQQWLVLEALTHVLPQLAARLQLIFQREAVCDFTETALAAQRALGNLHTTDSDQPTDLALRLDYRIQHILLDEAQDTSSLQFNLLHRLSAGWQVGDGRTLFLVGDAMQSLYGFRNANVGLFLDSRRHPIGDIRLQALDLSTNFRSCANIIHWVNRVFTKVFPDAEEAGRGATPYTYSQAVRGLENGVSKAAITIDTLSPDASNADEAEQVAARVLASRKRNPKATVAILVRGRGHLNEILPALYRRGLSWQATDIDSLGGRMPVIDLLSLTRALLCPADRIAWLSVLRAPWSGLNHADLHAMATSPANSNSRPPDSFQPAQTSFPLLLTRILSLSAYQNLSNDGQNIVKRMAGVLSSAWQQRYRKPLRSWIEGVWIALGGPAAQLNSGALQQCRRYFELLETHSSLAEENWPAFLEIIDRGHTVPEPDADPYLQIMTIHKAKGLEFDTVIIPGLHRQGRSNQRELLLWQERVNSSGRTDLIMSPPPYIGGDEDTIYQYLRREEKLKGRLEDARVLYVACTRAKNYLHLIFKQPGNGKPGANTPLGLLWDALAEDFNDETITPNTDVPGDEEKILADVIHHPAKPTSELNKNENLPGSTLSQGVRLPPDWSLDRQHFTARNASEPGDHQSTVTIYPSTVEERRARLAGTLFHRTAQQIVREGLNQWNSSRIERQKTLWHSELKALGSPDDTADANTQETVDKLERAVTQMLNHTEGRWLLAEHRNHNCELSLNYMDDALRVRTAILDRTFVDDKDVRWVIDYKLAEPHTEESLTGFLENQVHAYQEQLAFYQNLLQNKEENTVKTALYFPLLPHLELL